LEKDVIFMSHLNDRELARMYHSSDICLHPVLEQSFGLTPFEAIVSGIPVVLSDRCGAVEIFQNYVPNMVVDSAPNILARKIIEIYRNYDEFMNYVKEFRKIIISKLSPRKYSERILKIIKKYY
jgi:glycosyltransferase involved in cell wall biosynthesis